ncbi:MAG TPA: heme o synthase [Gemmatimonadaceae bacterium]
MTVRGAALGAPADYVALTKPRIVALVMLTVAAGFVVALPTAARVGLTGNAGTAPLSVQLWILANLLVGTALVAGGTNALNQIAERDVDALMRRTQSRPLPARRLEPSAARWFAWSIAFLGVAQLAVLVNPVTAFIAALTLASYVFAYTPLKRRTSLATLVGAVPGALPIVGGWTGSGAPFDAGAYVLFGILFLWQMPHFLALSWMYRADYARAGLKMLSIEDETGAMTFRQAALNAAALIPISLAPTALGIAGRTYFGVAAVLSGMLLALSIAASRQPSPKSARRLFLSTLLYLPVLLGVLVANRLV